MVAAAPSPDPSDGPWVRFRESAELPEKVVTRRVVCYLGVCLFRGVLT
jgi:hypothetical protein